jgi:transposase
LRRAIAIDRQADVEHRTEVGATTTTEEWRGPVLDVVRELLAEGHSSAVLKIFEKLVVRNSELEMRLAQMMSRGSKSERVSRDQLKLFLETLANEDNAGELSDEQRDEVNNKLRQASGIDEERTKTTQTQPTKQPSLRNPLPSTLERRDNLLHVPGEKRACPRCGKQRQCIGHDVTEVAELDPAKIFVRRDIREKLACDDCEGEIVRAPQGDKVVTGGKLGSTLVAALLVDKYRDGLPLHRQKKRFEEMGLALSVSTLADQVTWATDLLRPLHRAAIARVLASSVMHIDGTGLPVQDKQAQGGKRLGTLWGYVGDDVAAYLYASTGKSKGQKPEEIGPAEFLAMREGYTVADAATIFDASFERDTLIECGCNMHARRYFRKALDNGDKRAALPLAAYKKLYEIEAKVRDLDADGRLAARIEQSKPVFDELVSWAQVHEPHEPPSSPMGKAIRYLLNHQVPLGRFLTHGVIPMDNGAVERFHVRAALTRKNYLFAGSDAGAERAAIAYTILGCCALADVNPLEYLADILPKLARGVRLRDVPAMLPVSWKAARVGALSAAAAE